MTRLKYTLRIGLVVLTLTGCGQLDTLPFTPRQTPETWLRIQPFSEIQIGANTLIVVQPTTTAIVYLLGLVAMGAGLYFLRLRGAHRSRLWWGVALELWGIGALLAGTSYEAFSYHLKCAGRPACVWTSWWEIGYLLVSVASVDAMLVAQAYAGATGRRRRLLMLAALGNLVGYGTVVLSGALIPVQFLISFELLLVFAAPVIVFFILQNGWRCRRYGRAMDCVLLKAWLWLVLTIGGYFLYLISGLTQQLWARGFWFSENDVLHLGLLVWMVYLAAIVAKHVEDDRPISAG